MSKGWTDGTAPVAAGLDPWQVLAAATTAAGELVGRSWGLAPGDEGSIVLPDASPIADVRNTRAIHGVVHHGVWIDRDALLVAPPGSEVTAAVTADHLIVDSSPSAGGALTPPTEIITGLAILLP